MRLYVRILLISALLGGCTPDAADSETLSPSAVQGTGSESPYVGQLLTVSGIVSGDFQDDDADTVRSLGGFFLLNDEPDGDPLSSDGVFVFDRNADTVNVALGDRVQVAGKVSEYFGETQIVAESVRIVGRGEVRYTPLKLPVARIVLNDDGIPVADLEAYEGMPVTLGHPLYVQDLHGLERYGELLLSTEPREMQFTSGNRPDTAGYEAHGLKRAARSLLLDDGSAEQNPKPIQYVNGDFAPGFPLRVGDELQALSGVLRYSRGNGGNGMQAWRLLPVTEPVFINRNPRPARPDVGGDLVIASFNVLNYFAQTDSGKAVCGPVQKDGCRGADSEAELERQRAKTAAAINALDADIVGLMELENSAGASQDDLLAALNQRQPGWAAIRTGVVGGDAIQVALIYRSATVETAGDFAVLDRSVDPGFDDNRNRPVVAQSFRARQGGAAFTVAVAHLKSKGSPCNTDNDPNRGDGQANCNLSRTRAAQALVNWLASDPTGSGNPFALAIGDFNAYMKEDPIRAMEEGGLTNLIRKYVGEGAWSLVYRGESGALDHAFATPALAPYVSGAAEWHINADEAPLYDYNLEFARDPALFEPDTPWRAADHDPLLIGLRLPAE